MAQYFKDWLWNDYAILDSTNDTAKSYAIKGNQKVIITAKEQTKGRGRRGRTWISPKGNLFMSLLFNSKISLSDIAFAASLSIAQTIKQQAKELDVKIKWPNDILINEKKVSGMLIETGENGIVVGIGVNLITSPAKNEIIYSATNLKNEGIIISRKDFLAKYIKIFDENIKKCEMFGLSAIREDWLEFAHNLFKNISIRQGNNVQNGIFMGIDEQGYLLLKQQQAIAKISVGDVIEQEE